MMDQGRVGRELAGILEGFFETRGTARKARGRRAVPADFLLDVPSASTPRVQEAHLVLLHLLAEEIEERLG